MGYSPPANGVLFRLAFYFSKLHSFRRGWKAFAFIFMNLDEAQRKKVTEWIQQGLKLSDIQNRLLSELGITMKYIEVRLLVDDLKLIPKDPEPPRPSPLNNTPSPAPAEASPPPSEENPLAPEAATAPGSISVQVDHLAKPGAVVSGKVTFSDGKKAEWYFDQTGRLGLVPEVPGYRPIASDLQQFQTALDVELRKMGF